MVSWFRRSAESPQRCNAIYAVPYFRIGAYLFKQSAITEHIFQQSAVWHNSLRHWIYGLDTSIDAFVLFDPCCLMTLWQLSAGTSSRCSPSGGPASHGKPVALSCAWYLNCAFPLQFVSQKIQYCFFSFKDIMMGEKLHVWRGRRTRQWQTYKQLTVTDTFCIIDIRFRPNL